MLIEEIKNIKCGKREVSRFGISLGIALLLLGGVFFLRGKDYCRYFFILSPVFLFLGLFLSSALRPVYKAWMTLAIVIGSLITNLILILLFYFILTPIGLVSRIFGQDFLKQRLDRNAETYWIPREETKFGKGSYEKQF